MYGKRYRLNNLKKKSPMVYYINYLHGAYTFEKTKN